MVLVVLLMSMGVQAAVAPVLSRLVEQPWTPGVLRGGSSLGSGFFWASLTLVSGLVEVGGVLLCVHLRRCCSVRGYLAWHGTSFQDGLGWVGVAFALMVVMDGLTWLAGRPLVPDVLADAYRSAGSIPLFWLAIVGVAPLSEEIVFRGFLYRGLERSGWGAASAIVGSGLAWTFLHGQYDVWGMLMVLMAGMVLGVARWRSGSVVVPWGIHVMLNLVALVQASWLGGA